MKPLFDASVIGGYTESSAGNSRGLIEALLAGWFVSRHSLSSAGNSRGLIEAFLLQIRIQIENPSSAGNSRGLIEAASAPRQTVTVAGVFRG